MKPKAISELHKTAASVAHAAVRSETDAASSSPWRPPTRRWFLGAVAVAATVAVIGKPKPVTALPTRWIGHC